MFIALNNSGYNACPLTSLLYIRGPLVTGTRGLQKDVGATRKKEGKGQKALFTLTQTDCLQCFLIKDTPGGRGLLA